MNFNYIIKKRILLDDDDLCLLSTIRATISLTQLGYVMLYIPTCEPRVMTKTGRKRCSVQRIFLHRWIMENQVGDISGHIIDHINMNKLDNRKENLRLCTHSQNKANRNAQTNNKTGYKGVYYRKRGNTYQCNIKKNGLSIHIGYFKDPLEAARAYNSKAIELFGEFARLNEI